MSTGDISIIIPTYRREEPLCRMLRSLLAVDLHGAEILLIDQSCCHEDGTLEYLDSVAGQVSRIPRTTPSVTAACNAGAARARGTILLFLDDDIEVGCTDFLGKHAITFEDSSVGGVVGRIINPANPERRNPPFEPMAPLGFLDLHFDHDVPTDYPTMAGANMSVRKEVWEEVGGFDERYTGDAFRWETDFSFRLRKAGWRIRFEPSAWVVHHYGTPGGCGNVNLLGRSAQSHEYYRNFFRNNYLFISKHFRGAQRIQVVWRLYREHVLNRAYLRQGFGFLWQRHLALLHGATMAHRLMGTP